jgi:muramoyltetrapeptide carboxypeptidase LdcA involved in peptidoglycan recycling
MALGSAVLQPGDLVQLVAPSGWIQPALAKRAVETLAGWGLVPRLEQRLLPRLDVLVGRKKVGEAVADSGNDAL